MNTHTDISYPLTHMHKYVKGVKKLTTQNSIQEASAAIV